jgi:2-oxo-4-hydroxy-4-carboxy--5-ureidoimidazoline (OHCU) decarboxylase
LAQWNAQYRARFGFRFTIFAGRHDQASAGVERRLAGKPAVEYRTAWSEIAPITTSRLAARLQAPGMPVIDTG